MNTNNPLFNFFAETVQRFLSKNPKYFAVWQWILGALAAATGLPALINSAISLFALHLPAVFFTFENKTVAIAVASAMVMSRLTIQSQIKGVDPCGDVVKQTDVKSLPFTANAEIKKAVDNNVPQVVVNPVDAKVISLPTDENKTS